MNLKVMTFNIRNGLANDGDHGWEHRRHLTAKVIRDARADVIGLQEVFDFQLDYLMEALPEYDSYSIGREDGASQGEQCSILWRRDRFHAVRSGTFWLSDAPDTPNSMTWGNRITRICSWAEFAEGFRFYNTHWDHESSNARRRSAALMREVLPASPWILVGDFNEEPDSADLEPLAHWEDAVFVTKDNRFGTFHDFRGGSDGVRIDHMFVGTGVRGLNSEVIQTGDDGLYPSDHYPVIVEVDL